MTRVKVCGVTRVEDAAHAAAADFVGLNFWPQSKRHVDAKTGRVLAAAVRAAGAAKVVGVFVDATLDAIADACARADLDIVQLHGTETVERVAAIARIVDRPVWKAVAVASAGAVEGLDAWPTAAILLDTPTPGRGGSGQTFDWTLATAARRRYPTRQLVLAGGLAPDNVARAIRDVAPWAVDVASGVEDAPGIKSAAKIAAFLAAARQAT